MPYNAADKRSRLTEAAIDLAYQQGFERTTLAQVAQQAEVPLGNVYYYFKTREELGEAILEMRAQRLKQALDSWDKLDSPIERIVQFVHMTSMSKDVLALHGCPVGSLCGELSKVGGSLAEASTPLLGIPLTWLTSQFEAMGKGGESYGLAIHLLSALEGASLLAHNFKDPSLVEHEAARIENWLMSGCN